MIELKGKHNKDCKIFTANIESEAIQMIQSILDQRVSADVPVRIMPDVHAGKGIVIGFTMPMTKLLSPNYIGVDIGCGVLSAKISKLDMSLADADMAIRKVVPMGFSVCEKANTSVFDFAYLNRLASVFAKNFNSRFGENIKPPTFNESWVSNKVKQVDIDESKFYRSIGSLGSGNHFLELGVDENGENWMTVHCGSRNFGLKVAKFHNNVAKSITKTPPRAYLDALENIKANTPKKSDIPNEIADLKAKYGLGDKSEYLSGEYLADYLFDMLFAQYYAEINRKTIMKNIVKAISVKITETVESVHNYIDFDDLIIRKGAIPSYVGKKAVVPFNMRDGLLICEGKSNEDWNYSAPHGAGRIMSRSKAKAQVDLDDFKDSMKDVYSSSVCASTLDESPMAYKDANEIESLISDTLTVLHKVKPILNLKSAN